MKLYRTIALAAASVLTVACNLDIKPVDSIVYDEKDPLIQTDNDLETYRWSNYAFFRSSIGGGYDVSDDVMCEGFNATQNYGNNYGTVHRADKTFTASDEYAESLWATCYSSIKNYNLLIAELDKVTDDSLIDGVKLIAGEAYFFRAHTYLRLARRFARYYTPATAATDLCVPLVLKYDQAERPARATVAKVYEQIGKDIAKAYELLAERQDVSKGAAASNNITLDAIKALEANYLLDIQDYKGAYEKASAIAESGNYDFAETEDQFIANYTSDGGETGNPESIMTLFVSVSESPNSYAPYTEYGKDTNSPTGYSYKSYFLPSQLLIDSYEAQDWRYRNWFDDCTTDPYAYGGQYYTKKFYVFTKYAGNPALNANKIPNARVAPVIYNLSEICLIAAEAAIKGGATAEDALEYLNAVRGARNATPYSFADLVGIQSEWFRETVGEGKRIECMKRWCLSCEVRTGQKGALAEMVLMEGESYNLRALTSSDYHFVWPIPAYEIKVNPNLVQNPGYGDVE